MCSAAPARSQTGAEMLTSSLSVSAMRTASIGVGEMKADSLSAMPGVTSGQLYELALRDCANFRHSETAPLALGLGLGGSNHSYGVAR